MSEIERHHLHLAIGFLIAVVAVLQTEYTMLYFQVVIMAATVMLVYYCEFTDTFSPAQQGFICRDPALAKPDPGPEQNSRIQPVILYSVVGGLPVVLVSQLKLLFYFVVIKIMMIPSTELDTWIQRGIHP